ncbi:MAG: capsular biosynthesis protein [Actinobacteria bacterium]|nr:capsular biosynthesis protein [Actinomycetota bacterium]
MTEQRAFLFLQGPPGPFFCRLGAALQSRGIPVYRINLSGGDQIDWPQGSVNFRDRFSNWPVFLDQFLRDKQITDLMLFGDCRPYHVSAHGIASQRGVRTHVLEEGYVRPHWMTLELEGVNARSSLSRDKEWFISEASQLPLEAELPPVTASFRRRSRDSYLYYRNVLIGRWRYLHYRSHRSGSIVMEALGWTWRFLRAGQYRKVAEAVLADLVGKPIFILPLQLSGDYQIRTHSSFPDMQSAAAYTIASFASHAPQNAHLLLKGHPLDCSFFDWSHFVKQQARLRNLANRIHYIDGGDLEEIVRAARGLVCVNSTSATLALANGTPVCTIGEAIYDIAGLTHPRHLDSFWTDAQPPEPGLYAAFRRVLADRCLVRGGLASESAVTTLIGSVVSRLGI